MELKPCPFCGGTAHIEQYGDRRRSCIVECGSCGARLESSDEGDRSGSSWNDRPEIDRLTRQRDELVAFVQEWLDRQGSDINYMTEKASAALAKVKEGK